jgi:hypothetical protein
MRRKAALAFGALVVWTLIPAGALAGGQTPASKDPQVSGPLAQTAQRQCASKTYKTPAGEKLVTIKGCFWAYELEVDVDLTRDYEAYWEQMTATPAAGWCLTQVDLSLGSSPTGSELHSWAPTKVTSAKKVTKARVALTVDGDGAAIIPGEVAQTFQKLPGKFRPRGSKKGAYAAVTWRGQTHKVVALPIGLQVSWPVDSSDPQEVLDSAGVNLSTCGGASASLLSPDVVRLSLSPLRPR